MTFNHGVQGSIPWRVTKALVYASAFFYYVEIQYIISKFKSFIGLVDLLNKSNYCIFELL